MSEEPLEPLIQEAARLFAAADLSAESRVRARLRARLLARRPAPRPAGVAARLAPCAAAAALLLALWSPRAGRTPAIRTFPAREQGPAVDLRRRGAALARPAELLQRTPGVVVRESGRVAVRFDLDGGVFVLESRPVSLDELIVHPKISSIVRIE